MLPGTNLRVASSRHFAHCSGRDLRVGPLQGDPALMRRQRATGLQRQGARRQGETPPSRGLYLVGAERLQRLQTAPTRVCIIRRYSGDGFSETVGVYLSDAMVEEPFLRWMLLSGRIGEGEIRVAFPVCVTSISDPYRLAVETHFSQDLIRAPSSARRE